jgi:hypothetical protein
VKMYAIASALINFIGSMASLGFTEALTLDHGYLLPERLKLALAIYLVCSVVFFIGPALILWRVYRDAVNGLCASLAVADPSSLHLLPRNSGHIRMTILLLGAAFILIAVGLFLLTMRRHS